MSKIIVANWKTNLNQEESISHLQAIPRNTGNTIIVAPAVQNLNILVPTAKHSDISLCSQSISITSTDRPLTDEEAPTPLDPYIKYALIGHSDRRIKCHESDETVKFKLEAALDNGMIVILCVGETSDEYDVGQTESVLKRQITSALLNIASGETGNVIIAYEPVWAISTSDGTKPAVNQVTALAERLPLIKSILSGLNLSDNRILAGGSVNHKNIKDIILSGYEGVLIGRASLDTDEFSKCCEVLES